MTEFVVESADQPSSNAVTRSSGQLLRQAREQQQITVQALAATLKVPEHKLLALEEDRWDALTDSVFTRSLALSVCRVLKIPTEPVLAGLPKYEGAKLSSNPEGINAPFKEKSLRSLMTPSDSGTSSTTKVLVALAIAVAGSAALYFLPHWQSDDTVAESSADETQPLFAPQTAGEAAAGDAGAAPAVNAGLNLYAPAEPDQLTVQADAPSEGAAREAAETTPPAADQPAEAAAPTAPAAEPPVADSTTTTAAGQGPALRFATTGDSWVQVRDADGKVVMEKMMKAGDVYEQTASSRPLKVVVGNAGATTLEVDGVALNLTNTAKNNVARVEVK